MSYKPPRPEQRSGPSSVGPHEQGVLVRTFKVLLGVTISITLLVLFAASAVLAWVILFTGPSIEIRAAEGGIEIVVPENQASNVARVRIARRTDGEVVWEIAARERFMVLPPLRLRAGSNPVDPGVGGPVRIVSPPTGTTFPLEASTGYALTIWGPNPAGGRGSSTRRFTLSDERGVEARP